MPQNNEKPLTADQIKTVSSAHRQILEYDRMIDREAQAYDNWFLVAGVAGLSLAVTQGDVLLGDNGQSKLLVAAAAVHVIAIFVGVGVKYLGTRLHSYSRQVMTLVDIQYFHLCRLPPKEKLEDYMLDLMGEIEKGEHLLGWRRKKWKTMRKKMDVFESLRKWASRAQQTLIAAGYVAIVCLFAGKHL